MQLAGKRPNSSAVASKKRKLTMYSQRKTGQSEHDHCCDPTSGYSKMSSAEVRLCFGWSRPRLLAQVKLQMSNPVSRLPTAKGGVTAARHSVWPQPPGARGGRALARRPLPLAARQTPN